jgi:hypothetical protein
MIWEIIDIDSKKVMMIFTNESPKNRVVEFQFKILSTPSEKMEHQ